MDVFHPVEIGLLVLLGCELDGLLAIGAWLDGGDGFLGERLDLDEPLGGEARLDHGLAAVAVGEVVCMVFDDPEEPLRLEVSDDLLADNITVEACICAALGIDVAGIVHHVDGCKMMAFTESEVVGVVCRGHLDCACAEVAADPLIQNDGDFTANQRQAQLLTVEMEVALILGMNGHGHVAQHGFGASGSYGQKLSRILAFVVENGVANLPEMALLLFVDDFEVADGGLAAWAPIYDVGAAINKALLL